VSYYTDFVGENIERAMQSKNIERVTPPCSISLDTVYFASYSKPFSSGPELVVPFLRGSSAAMPFSRGLDTTICAQFHETLSWFNTMIAGQSMLVLARAC